MRRWLVKNEASYNITVCMKKDTQFIFIPELHAQLIYEGTHWELKGFSSSCLLFCLCSTSSISKCESVRGTKCCKGMTKEISGMQPCNTVIGGDSFTPDLVTISPVHLSLNHCRLRCHTYLMELDGNCSWQKFVHAAYLNLGIRVYFISNLWSQNDHTHSSGRWDKSRHWSFSSRIAKLWR